MALSAFAVAAFVVLGLPDGVLGVAWPSMQSDFDRQLGELGVVLTALTVGYLVMGATHGALSARLGSGRLLLTMSAVSTAGAFTFAGTHSWPVLIVASAVWGGAAAAIDSGVNAHFALSGRASSLGFLHAGFGLGAALGPFLVAAIADAGGSWRVSYLVLGAAQGAVTIGYWMVRHRWAPAIRRARERATSGPALFVGMTVFFIYTGIEVAAGQWSFTVLTQARDISSGRAAALVGGYWACLTAGRLALGIIGERVATERLLAASAGVVVFSSVLFWWNPTSFVGGAGLLLTGFGLAPIFPLLVLQTPRRLGADGTHSAIGFQLAAAALGAAAVPGAIGIGIEWLGLGVVGPSLAGCAVIQLALLSPQLRNRPMLGREDGDGD